MMLSTGGGDQQAPNWTQLIDSQLVPETHITLQVTQKIETNVRVT